VDSERPQNIGQLGEATTSASTDDAIREQQAIAAAMMIGEELRRGDRSQTHALAKRIGFFMASMAVFGLVVLFGYARLAGDEFNPYPYMIMLGLLAAASVVAAYWGYAESRRPEK
jgi:hypothetical protein